MKKQVTFDTYVLVQQKDEEIYIVSIDRSKFILEQQANLLNKEFPKYHFYVRLLNSFTSDDLPF